MGGGFGNGGSSGSLGAAHGGGGSSGSLNVSAADIVSALGGAMPPLHHLMPGSGGRSTQDHLQSQLDALEAGLAPLAGTVGFGSNSDMIQVRPRGRLPTSRGRLPTSRCGLSPACVRGLSLRAVASLCVLCGLARPMHARPPFLIVPPRRPTMPCSTATLAASMAASASMGASQAASPTVATRPTRSAPLTKRWTCRCPRSRTASGWARAEHRESPESGRRRPWGGRGIAASLPGHVTRSPPLPVGGVRWAECGRRKGGQRVAWRSAMWIGADVDWRGVDWRRCGLAQCGLAQMQRGGR